MAVSLQAQRQKILSVLAKSPLSQLLDCWGDIDVNESFNFLKKPEIGMAMVRSQAGNEGECFNMGEMTMTRCVIQLDSSEIGYGFVAGRSKKKSELVALIDACWQKKSLKESIEEKVIRPLQKIQNTKTKEIASRTESSKVNFFTMVRGE